MCLARHHRSSGHFWCSGWMRADVRWSPLWRFPELMVLLLPQCDRMWQIVVAVQQQGAGLRSAPGQPAVSVVMSPPGNKTLPFSRICSPSQDFIQPVFCFLSCSDCKAATSSDDLRQETFIWARWNLCSFLTNNRLYFSWINAALNKSGSPHYLLWWTEWPFYTNTFLLLLWIPAVVLHYRLLLGGNPVWKLFLVWRVSWKSLKSSQYVLRFNQGKCCTSDSYFTQYLGINEEESRVLRNGRPHVCQTILQWIKGDFKA